MGKHEFLRKIKKAEQLIASGVVFYGYACIALNKAFNPKGTGCEKTIQCKYYQDLFNDREDCFSGSRYFGPNTPKNTPIRLISLYMFIETVLAFETYKEW